MNDLTLVDTIRLPLTALFTAQSQGLVGNDKVIMDDEPLRGGVAIYQFAENPYPVLIGQRDWMRVYHVFAEPDYDLMTDWHMTNDGIVASLVNDALIPVPHMGHSDPLSYQRLIRHNRALRILGEYYSRSDCMDKTAVMFCMLKIHDELYKEQL